MASSLLQYFSLQCLSVMFFIIFTASATANATQFNFPTLGVVDRRVPPEVDSLFEDHQTFFYPQTLDHFSYRPQSYTLFPQRYVMNFKYWGGANSSSPIFAYLGAEENLDYDLSGVGFLSDNAPHFKALLVYIEHRFYGESIPSGIRGEALSNKEIRGLFNSAQALADYAEILIYIKMKLHAENCPIIVFGGSYGGMLASWFRLKYPHVALGALASSAPLLYFDNITPQNGYYVVVTKDFKEASESCYDTIRKSWFEIDGEASKPNGLSMLSNTFKTCSELKSSYELKGYLENMYTQAAQYNHPPEYPVTKICGGIDGAPKGSNILTRIFAGLAAYRVNWTCYDTNTNPTESSEGWQWQKCSEMVMPIGRGENETMFEPSPFNLIAFTEYCINLYGVPPRPHWITTYYGGHDIELVLRRFGSNIIFTNGLRDPYSIGGVLKNISDTLLAIYTVNGSHCLDLYPANATTDPQWLVMQRKSVVQIIGSWIATYYADLNATKNLGL